MPCPISAGHHQAGEDLPGSCTACGSTTGPTRRLPAGVMPRPGTCTKPSLPSQVWEEQDLGKGRTPRSRTCHNQEEFSSIYLSLRASPGSRANRAGDLPTVLVKAVLNALGDP